MMKSMKNFILKQIQTDTMNCMIINQNLVLHQTFAIYGEIVLKNICMASNTFVQMRLAYS